MKLIRDFPLTYWPRPPRLPRARPLQLGAQPLLSAPDSLGGRGRSRPGPREPRVRGKREHRDKEKVEFPPKDRGGLCPALHPGAPAPPPAVWSAPRGAAGSRAEPAAVRAGGGRRGSREPSPGPGCGRGADSRSRYVSPRARPGRGPSRAPPAAGIYLFRDSCARRRRGPASARPRAWVRGLHPPASSVAWLPAREFDHLCGCSGRDLGSAAGMCARPGRQSRAGALGNPQLRFSRSLAPGDPWRPEAQPLGFHFMASNQRKEPPVPVLSCMSSPAPHPVDP